jgi:hypothetical protein
MGVERAEVEQAPARPQPGPAETPALPALAARVLQVQRTAGNRAARRLLARDDIATAAMVHASTQSAMAAAKAQAAAVAQDWLNVVPDAEERKYVTTKLVDDKQTIEYKTAAPPKPKKGEAPAPEPAPLVFTADQQQKIDAACKAVADYRATLPDPVATGGINKNQGASWAGTWWTRYTAMSKKYRPPAPTKKNPNPDDPRTAEEKAAYESASSYNAWLAGVSKSTGTQALPAAGADTGPYRAWLGDRLFLDIAGLEGGTDSINVYDKQILTWGGGLGGASGAVPGAMKLVADSTATGGGKTVGAEVTRVLHSAGISFGTNAKGYPEFVVCDPGSKRKYRGDSALHLIKADNRLLMLFTNISRGELPGVDVDTDPPAAAGQPAGVSLKDATRKAVYDAQKNYFLNKYNTGDFGKAVMQLGPTWPYDSLMMVLHLEWWGVSKWTQFKDTGGDMTKIIKKAFELYTSYVEKRNGANVAVRDLAAHLQDFGGASSEACWGPETQLATDKPQADAYYVETKKAVAFKAAVPDTIEDGKVVKKGKAEVKAEDAKYRKLN